MDYYGIKITGGQGQSSLKPTLCGHQKPVLTVSWSPDDSQILTCGQEEGMRPWDVMAVSELSRLRTFLEMENVPVRRLIVNQILHPSASDCKFCAVKRKELKPKTCRGGANYNLTGETRELEGRLRGGRYRDGRQGLVVAGRDPAIGGHGWSEGEVPCFSVLVPLRNFHSKADQETIRSSATKFQI
ncbi:hypothetical protein QQP08_004808 [Theobroma cacao]|nr:hypothetical protein QQP08_004808 [Theobroma cacao]